MKKKLSLIGIAIVLALSLVMVVAPTASAAATGVNILTPTVAAPAVTNTGGSVEVTVQITVNADDYYTVQIMVMDDLDPLSLPTSILASYSDLLYLTNGTTTVTRLLSVAPGVAANTTMGVVCSVDGGTTPDVDYDYEGDPTDYLTLGADYTVMSIAIPGTTITTTLIGKSVMVIESVMDKFVLPSTFNTALESGDANDALTSDGSQLVDGVSDIVNGGVDVAGEGVSMGGEILSAVRGAVVTKVPTIVNGALSLVNEIVSLFSSTAPLAP